MKRTLSFILAMVLLLSFMPTGILGITANAAENAGKAATFTINWRDSNGVLLKTTTCNYGETPVFEGETPIRKSDSQYDYTFSGWKPEVKAACCDAEYIAVYKETARTAYVITYDANGGSNAPAPQTKTAGESISLSYSIPTLEGYTFLGWRCAQTSYRYSRGASFNIDADVTLYAAWGKNCSACKGNGGEYYTTTCTTCSGTGGKTTKTCSNCGGTGGPVTQKCSFCRGMGKMCANCGGISVTILQGYGQVCSSCYSTSRRNCGSCSGKGSWQVATCSSCNGKGSWTEYCTSCGGDGTTSRYTPCYSCDDEKYSVDNTTYTVSLYSDSALMNTNTVYHDRPYQLTVPTKAGYSFLGWFDSPEGGTQYTDSEGVSLSVWGQENKSLYAHWSLNYYTITYDCDQSYISTDMPLVYTIEDGVILLESQLHGHYTLDWRVDGKIVESFDTTIVKDVVAKGVWTPITYTITYYLDGGTAGNPTTYDVETETFSLVAPTKKGYTFVGWTGSNGNVPQKEVTIATNDPQNLSFTANWSINVYNITYELYGGTNARKNPATFTVEDNVALSAAEKDQYTFEGWYLDAAFTKKITNVRGYSSDLTLYAHFVPYSYNATFDSAEGWFSYDVTLVWGGGLADEVLTYKSRDTFYPYEVALPNYSGYLFNGWYLDSSFTTPLPETYTVTSDMTLYARWYKKASANAKELTLGDHSYVWSSYDNSNDYYFYVSPAHSGQAAVSYSLYGTKTEQYVGVKSSQFFIEDCTTGIELFFKMNGSNLSSSGNTAIPLVAGHTYRLHTYTITNNSISGKVDVIISIGQDPLLPKCVMSAKANVREKYGEPVQYPVPVLDDYDFDGWYTEGGDPIGDVWSYTQNTTFYPKWKFHGFTIRYELNGGANDPLNPASYTVVDPAITLLAPNKAGYTFLGWYTDPDFQNQITQIDCQSRLDYTLYAKWIADFFAVRYELNGGVNHPSNIQLIGRTEEFVLLDPSRDGYSFAGWYLEASCKTKVTTLFGSEHRDQKVYAKWTANTYTATLDYAGGENCPTIKFVSQGSVIKTVELYKDTNLHYFIPDAPSADMRFAGWYTNAACTDRFSFNGVINYDLTVYAKWVSVDLSYEYLDLGGTYDASISGVTQQYLGILSPITQTVTVSSASGLDLFGKIYNANMQLLYSCDDISDENLDFSITFTMEAGKVYYIAYKANQAMVSGTATIRITGTQVPNLFITGDYTEVIERIEVTYATSFTLPVPKRDGYVFCGWFDEEDTQVTNGKWLFAADKTFTAKWDKCYTVTFLDLDGNTIATGVYCIGQQIAAPALPTKAPDETYRYHAKWNNGYTGVCTGEAVYSPEFEAEYIEYTVIFADEDGTELSSASYHWGDPVTQPAAPAKAADNTYTYTFAGWDQAVVACAGDATYTAIYTATYIDYTVVFKNWDGSVISTNTYHYGDKVVVPADPTREADSTYIYIFDGWDTKVVDCAGDAVYTATYQNHAEHVFTNACDTTCNVCGHTRTTEHNYVWVTEKANNCGVDGSKYERCTVCRATRNVGTVIPATGEHKYTNGCDASCNVCGQVRVVDDHVYENVCDKDCNVCGYVRSSPEHIYDNACDGTCNLCGTERTPADHVYDGGDYCTACALYAGLEYRRYSWEDTVCITGFDENYRGAFVIPATINGYPVTEIYYSTFEGCTGLTSVTIPDSVTEIGSRAFHGCTGLTSVTIPGSVTEIGVAAFYGCTDLTSVTIPDSVTEIGDSAFYGCTGLTSVTIPDSVTAIGAYAFCGCTGLTAVMLPDSVTEIGVAVFYGCTDLTSVTIPDSVTEIGNSAFYGCTGLTSVTITDGVTKIGSGAFYGCTGLTSVAIPDSVTEIGEAAFSDCTGLTSVTIPDSVTEIGSRAFYGCTGLTSVTIPGSVTEIGNNAFYGCTGLTSVTIPEGVTVIGDSAFSGCTGLTSVTIPGSVTEIGEAAFSDCTGLTSVTIPDSVTTVGKHAFSCCYGLRSITFGSGLTSIGMMAFMNCYNMEDVYITDVNAWCQIAFEDSYAVPYGEWHFLDENGNEITDITLDETVTQISNWAFSGCTGLTSVTIPGSVTVIGDSAFSGCTGLTAVTIPESVTKIGSYAFYGCTGLTEISVAEKNAVYHSAGNCLIETASKTLIFGIKTSTIPSDGSVTTIGQSAFEDCEGLTFITIPDGVTTIGGSAFYGCKGLTNVELPDSVTYLGGSAFGGCSNLTSVVLSAGVTTIEQFVFDGCYSLRYITIPKTVTYIRYAAIRGYSITDVYYSGDENDRAQLLIGDNNGNLPYATWHYNTCEKHTYDSICDNSCNACTWTRAVPGHHYPDGGGACDRCGHMQNGWVKENGIWYFYENGTMVKNAWRKDSKGWCYLLADGKMATSMWLQDSKGWCYIEANGYCATNCWKKDSTGWIWLDSEGSMTKNKWIKDGGKWYFLDAQGYMVTNKWSKDSVGWVYCGKDGYMLTNAWCKDSKGWCYVGADGYAVTNCWKKDSKGWIYLNSEGSMSYSKWIQDGGKWYYVDSTGYMVANRSLKIGGKTYKFNASGVCTNP